MLRQIIKYGEGILHTPALEVDKITSDIRVLIEDMIETMYAAQGIGLAAPQIGISLRIIVVDISFGQNSNDLVAMLNPEIIEHEGIQNEEEGCLSVPGFEVTVPRPKRVVIRGLSTQGKTKEFEGTDLLARAFQHELDHLEGALYLDRLRGIKRELILKKINKQRRAGTW